LSVYKKASDIGSENLRNDISDKIAVHQLCLFTRSETFYLTALTGGKPLKTTKLIVTQGLKWPPDVAEQIVMASRMPNAYANPICNTAADHEDGQGK